MNNGRIDWKIIEKESTKYLSDYLKIKTINPPGDEIKGAKFLKNILDREGIENEIIESASGRANLVSHLPGNGNEKPLLLLNHIDVVPVEEDKWTYPPFSGKIAAGEIWGRGALDCKSLGIIQTMVLILLKRTKKVLNRGVMMAATADEEKGGVWGVGWLCNNYPDITQVEAVINEGGGIGICRAEKNYYLCQVGEKGACWYRITFPGTPGHGSLPREDNCLFSLGQFLENLRNYQSRIQLTRIMEKFALVFSEDKEIGPLMK
ncbi:MAG: M20/M25/M40 family metallo-hydrolase, partial [Desulfobacterota bacterium]|nr:M20/M25/M40 family metallo-hydrolase [Thermodesulfobacteriota bacterium]